MWLQIEHAEQKKKIFPKQKAKSKPLINQTSSRNRYFDILKNWSIHKTE
jgi:hypothetical protein